MSSRFGAVLFALTLVVLFAAIQPFPALAFDESLLPPLPEDELAESAALEASPESASLPEIDPSEVKTAGGVLAALSGDVFLPPPEAGPEARARAVALWNEAAKLQLAKKYEDALEKYREGLSVFEDAVVREHVGKLESFLEMRRKREAEESARARAVTVWNEAASLQLERKYEEALVKYREGLEIASDPVVEEHVRKLEEFISARKAREGGKK